MAETLLRLAGWEDTARKGIIGQCGVLLLTLLLYASKLADAGSMRCPSANFSISEGSNGTTIADFPKNATLDLCHISSSSSNCESILAIRNKELSIYNSTYKGHFSISGNGLIVQNARKWLAGEYRLAYKLNNSCVHRFFLSVSDPWHCPSANFSIPAGSSEMIITNISFSCNKLALYRMNHSSSAWEHVQNLITECLNNNISTFELPFCISDNSLAIKNAYEGLAGEYQLIYGQNESCVRHFFLNISVSGSGWTAVLVAGVAGGCATAIVLVLRIIYVVWKIKWKNKKRHRELAQPSENGSLLASSPDVQKSRIDSPSRANGIICPGFPMRSECLISSCTRLMECPPDRCQRIKQLYNLP